MTDLTTDHPATTTEPPPETRDIMVDLETMSTRADAAIVAIGACWFNPVTGHVGKPLHMVVHLESSRQAGGHIDGDTVMWWLRQSEAARSVLTGRCRVDLEDALQRLRLYMHRVATPEHLRVWGNGADFDLPILATAYRNTHLDLPWRYFNGRCFRTLRNLFPDVAAPAFQGTEHNAADDAVHQARHAIAILQAVGAGA